MRFLLTSLCFILALLAAQSARAAGEGEMAEIVQCGEPVETTLPTGAKPYCDIYARQLVYRLEANELRKRIYERQHNFQNPAKTAREQYAKSLEKIDETRGEE